MKARIDAAITDTGVSIAGIPVVTFRPDHRRRQRPRQPAALSGATPGSFATFKLGLDDPNNDGRVQFSELGSASIRSSTWSST